MPSVTAVLQKVPFFKRTILTLGYLTLTNADFTSFGYALAVKTPMSVPNTYHSSRNW
jgi:hypothetical protein